MNGEHTISAELEIGIDMADGTHGHETISSNMMTVAFKNTDGVHVVLSGLGESAMNAETGELWYGGPDADLTIAAVPVKYSTGAVESVTLLGICGSDAMTDSTAPYEFKPDCKTSTPRAGVPLNFSLSSGGASIDVMGSLNEISVLRLDYEGPAAPHFHVNPNNREEGWVNASVNFTGEQGSGAKKDGWLVYNDTDADAGVGGYMPRLRYAPKPSDGKVKAVLAADPVESVVLPPGLTGATKKDALCVVVSAVDLLGNESKLPGATGDCKSAADYATTSDATTTYAAGLLAGVDLVAPAIKFSPASPKADDNVLRDFQVQATDAASGVRATTSVVAEASRRDAKETKKVDLTVNTELPLATTSDLVDAMGYYTFTAHTVDKAGNASEKITRTALHDTEGPVVGVIPGAYAKGGYSLTATVKDNISIKEYWAEMRFDVSANNNVAFGDNVAIANGGRVLPKEGAVAVDAYNASSLTTTTLNPSLMVQTYQFLQRSGITSVGNTLASIGVVASDHGGTVSGTNGQSGAPAALSPALTAPTEGLFDFEAGPITWGTRAAFTPAKPADRKVFQTFSATATTKESAGTVTLEAKAEGSHFTAPTAGTVDDPATTPDEGADGTNGTQGLRDNPLTRVDFYATVDNDGGNGRSALKYIGSVSGSAAGAQDYDSNTDDDNDANDSRRYIYSLTISKADFFAIVGGKGDYGVVEDGTADNTVDDTDEGAIIAFGVRDDKGLAVQAVPADLYVKR